MSRTWPSDRGTRAGSPVRVELTGERSLHFRASIGPGFTSFKVDVILKRIDFHQWHYIGSFEADAVSTRAARWEHAHRDPGWMRQPMLKMVDPENSGLWNCVPHAIGIPKHSARPKNGKLDP